ncbi:unnamed protein product [Ectocarpus sp. 6 AP-2014]
MSLMTIKLESNHSSCSETEVGMGSTGMSEKAQESGGDHDFRRSQAEAQRESTGESEQQAMSSRPVHGSSNAPLGCGGTEADRGGHCRPRYGSAPILGVVAGNTPPSGIPPLVPRSSAMNTHVTADRPSGSSRPSANNANMAQSVNNHPHACISSPSGRLASSSSTAGSVCSAPDGSGAVDDQPREVLSEAEKAEVLSRAVSTHVRAEIGPAVTDFMRSKAFEAALGDAFGSKKFETAVSAFCRSALGSMTGAHKTEIRKETAAHAATVYGESIQPQLLGATQAIGCAATSLENIAVKEVSRRRALVNSVEKLCEVWSASAALKSDDQRGSPAEASKKEFERRVVASISAEIRQDSTAKSTLKVLPRRYAPRCRHKRMGYSDNNPPALRAGLALLRS